MTVLTYHNIKNSQNSNLSEKLIEISTSVLLRMVAYKKIVASGEKNID